MADCNRVFIGTFVHSKTLDALEYLHDAAVCVDRAGKIVAVEKQWEVEESKEKVFRKLGWSASEVVAERCGEGQFFFPGFIDSHIHAPQYPNVGIVGKSTLLDWLETYTYPLEASLADVERARRVYRRVVRRTLSNGTTCAAYYAARDVESTTVLASVCLSAGQRALVGRVCMDQLTPAWYRDESAAASVSATRASIAAIRALDPNMRLVRPVITPRFAPSCSAELLRGLGALAAELPELAVQTHMGETIAEVALAQSMFPAAQTGAAEETYACLYDTFGLLTDRTILAHAVHLRDGEADLVARRGAKVAHCPCSNSVLGSGQARVRNLLRRGIACGLGTDIGGGYSCSVLEAARHAALVSRNVALDDGRDDAKLTVDEVLYLATRGGADVVGLADRVGAFKVGMDWDAQLVSLCVVGKRGDDGLGPGAVDVFGWESWDERVAKWLYGGDDRNTSKVWVKGSLVHERGWGSGKKSSGLVATLSD